jgi:hypothetical protein
MTKKTIAIIVFIVSIYSAWSFLNSGWFIITMAERKLAPIIQQGAKKETVLEYLVKIGLPANDATTHYSNGECATAHSGNFRWNCEYPSYVHTGWPAGFLNIFSPHIQVFFVFDEKNELVNYYTSVSSTFL